MLAPPLSPSMPSLESIPASLAPRAPTPPLSTDQPPALELYDSLDIDEDEDDDEDDDDDSSDGKLASDANLSDEAEADGGAVEAAAEGEVGEDGEEEDDEDEEELPEPCPRFYIRIKQFGPYVNYNTLLKHAQSALDQPLTDPATAPLLPLATQLTLSTTPPTTAVAAADGAATDVDAGGAPVAAADDEGDVQILGEGRTRRKRQSTQDEYDTNDPFIDDTELPQEREEDDMRTEIEGFHVQIGAVQVKEREVAVKQEQGEAADERRKKQQRKVRKEWTKRQIPMSAAMSAQLDKIVKECQLLGGSEALGGSHRRLPDELVELLVRLNDIYDKDSVAWDGTERKVLKHNMLERLEAAMGQTRQAIRSRMKTAVQRHRRDQLDQQIKTYKQALQKAAAHDYSDFHHRISTKPQPTATKGNVIVHKTASGDVQRFEYRPRFSLWMDDLLALAGAVVEAAGVQRGEDGRAMEAEGWKVEKELWDEVAGWWGAGVMSGKLIADRVKQARKDRLKKKVQQKKSQPANANATSAATTQTASKAAPSAADKPLKQKEKVKEKERASDKQKTSKKEKLKRKRDSGAATEAEKKKKKKAKKTADGKDSGKAADSASHKRKSASVKQQKEGGKDGTHKRSATINSVTASASSAASTTSQPMQSSVFYEPPAGVGRWSDVHFPPPATVVVKQSVAPNKSAAPPPPRDMQLTQTQR